MQLNNLDSLSNIATKAGFSIFELPASDFAEILPKSYHLKLEDKTYYSKEDIDKISALTHSKQTDDFVIVIEDAEQMNENAANTFLKTLEEPGQFVHFVFLVRSSALILPTIKSRAHNYYLPQASRITDKPYVSDEILELAKKYISATSAQLPKLATDIAKTKTDARAKAISVVDTAIQLLYKSYFTTGNEKFLQKLDKLLAVSEALRANGHIKLQLIAGML